MQGSFDQLRFNAILLKSRSSLTSFFNFLVWLRIFWKSSCVRATNSLISLKSFSHCAKWSPIAFLSSSTVFISFSGSFPPSNFFTASIKSRDLVLSKGAGFALFVGVPESFLTGIWDELPLRLFLLPILGLLMGLDSLDEGLEGSFRGCEGDKLITDALQTAS